MRVELNYYRFDNQSSIDSSCSLTIGGGKDQSLCLISTVQWAVYNLDWGGLAQSSVRRKRVCRKNWKLIVQATVERNP